ncbi:MAG: hypothetical protein A3C56_11855 [Ignavibacteria bacterium RIFCSPHIGHO2_02_FULL_56_12]|nr:MAG: hypothetical protein A3C56_11855 [Ignavibacteria bacterium RIFCSPHIGHO2_02_FULL_56_12]
MLARLRRRVGLAYTRFHFRKHRDATVRFSEIVTRSRRALVVFPETSLGGDTAETLLRYLTRRFSNGSTVVVVREDLRRALPATTAARVFTYTEKDLTTWYTPRSELIRRIKTSTFDVAFDLNVDFALPSAFLCMASNAPVRVSFTKSNGDDFYNLQIRALTLADQSTAYQSLMRCLDML